MRLSDTYIITCPIEENHDPSCEFRTNTKTNILGYIITFSGSAIPDILTIFRNILSFTIPSAPQDRFLILNAITIKIISFFLV